MIRMLLNNENVQKCRRVIDRFGYTPQTRQVAEECCELALASLKMLREHTCAQEFSENFKEELVDVIVMATQAVMMSGITETEINHRAQKKLDKVLNKHY